MSTKLYARSATATSPSTGYSVTACTMPRRVVGTGRVGHHVARLLGAFGCQVLASDPVVDEQLVAVGIDYVPRDELLRRSDIIALTCPLTSETFHLVDEASVATMKDGVMIVNTGRGALVDTSAVISGLKSGRIGSLGLDVYEEEAPLFFEDRSTEVITDDVFARLLTFPQRAAHRPPGVLHTTGVARHRRDHPVQPRRARRRRRVFEPVIRRPPPTQLRCEPRIARIGTIGGGAIDKAIRTPVATHPEGPTTSGLTSSCWISGAAATRAATRVTTSTTASTGSGGRPR